MGSEPGGKKPSLETAAIVLATRDEGLSSLGWDRRLKKPQDEIDIKLPASFAS